MSSEALGDAERQVARLEESNRRLWRHAQDVSTVAHVLSHDVTNILNTVGLMAVGLSLGRSSREELAQVSRETQDLVRKMAGMMRGFIRLTDVVRRPIQPVIVSLVEVADEVMEDVLVRADLTEEIDFKPEWGISHCWFDPDHMLQVFDQIFSNAVKFRDPNKPRLTITVTSAATADGVRVTIADNGLGIPADQQPRLFTLFSRAHPQVPDGLGIGLVIAKRLVELNNGSIQLESTEGQGTRITLNLPSAANLG